MLTLPENITRQPQAYAYVNFTVRMNQMQQPAQEGFPLLFGYLAEQGIEPVGAAFYNYRRINMADTLDVEAGVAVTRTGPDSDRVRFGTLPGGRFVTLKWHGHPDKLEKVTGMLISQWIWRRSPMATTSPAGSKSTKPTRPKSRTWTNG